MTSPHPDGRALQVRVRVTEAERKLIVQAATKANQIVSVWAREAMLACAEDDLGLTNGGDK